MSLNKDFIITDFAKTPSLTLPASSQSQISITADANICIMCWKRPEIQISVTEGKDFFQATHHKRTSNVNITDFREEHIPGEMIIRAPYAVKFLEAEIRNNSILQSDIVPYAGYLRLHGNAFASLSCHNLALLTDTHTCHAMCDVVAQKSDNTGIKGIGSAIVLARGGKCEITGRLSSFVTLARAGALVTHEGKVLRSMKVYRSGDPNQNGFILQAAGTRRIHEQLLPADTVAQKELIRNALRTYFTSLFQPA